MSKTEGRKKGQVRIGTMPKEDGIAMHPECIKCLKSIGKADLDGAFQSVKKVSDSIGLSGTSRKVVGDEFKDCPNLCAHKCKEVQIGVRELRHFNEAGIRIPYLPATTPDSSQVTISN
jgi:hypothetical protein